MSWARFFTASRVFSVGLFRFIAKHWYMFVILLVLIPNIVGAINTAVETQNPSYPFVVLGLSITNADSLIYDYVQDLEEDPSQVIGVEKPEKGVWKHIVYYWGVFKIAWKILGLIFLITIPFTALYKYYSWKGQKGNQSSIAQNLRQAIITGLIFIFVMNLIILIVNLLTGDATATLPEGNFYTKALYVIFLIIPLHGIISLIQFLAGV